MSVKKIRPRLFFVLFCFVAVCFGLFGRVGYIIYAYGDEYEKNVIRQAMSIDKSIPAMRGSILDRNGERLGYSTKKYNLILDPKLTFTFDEEIVAQSTAVISELSGIDAQVITDKLGVNTESRYKVLTKGISLKEAEKYKEKINNKEIVGLWLEETTDRVYPNNYLAAHVIGFEGNGVGRWGVEETYDKWLQGKNGRELMVASQTGMITEQYIAAENGHDLVLTIDETMQHFAEEELLKYVNEQKPLNATVTLMDPNSGEILAMAKYPSFDLNSTNDIIGYTGDTPYEELTVEEQNNLIYKVWRNSIVSDSFEPGSTYKPLTYAIALEEGLITMNSTFDCNGIKHVAGIPIRCWKRTGHGVQTVAEALANSCNVAVMEIAEKLDKNLYYKYQQAFGIGQLTGIDLVGEFSSAPLVYTPSRLGPTEMATTSFGQGFNVTPIQLIAANAAVINGGYLYKPHVVKQIINNQGIVVEDQKKEVVRKVVSEETSRKVREAMKDVVDYGTAKKAKIDGYTIAGKTGTAQKGDRDEENYLVSFLSYAPADDPQVIMLVTLDEPMEQITRGSGLTVEISREIYKRILPYMGIYPDTTTAP